MASYPYTIQDFEQAHEATGLKPRCGIELIADDTGKPVCGCPQGVLAWHKLGALLSPKTLTDPIRSSTWTAKSLGLSSGQFHEFALGYDYPNFSDVFRESDAYLRGRECRKRFMPHLPTAEPGDNPTR